MPKAIDYSKYGITFQTFINKLDKRYGDEPSQFYADMKERPYMVLISVAGVAFKSADELIQKRRYAMPDSRERCLYAVYHVLANNEAYGNTRMNDSELARQVNGLCPEAMGHIVDIVKDSSGIYYEPSSHWVSKRGTYNAEVNIAEHIKHRIDNPVKLDVDVNKYKHNGDFDLTDEQLSALQMVADNSVCMVNGAAGSGKTQTTNAILDMLDNANKSYVCLAPTGIASKQLRVYTGRPSSTIHMFLTGPWAPDYLILDETSICGIHLLSALLEAIGKTPNLIFVGDSAQLASISCGSIIRDIIESNAVPRVILSKIFRYNTSGIVTIATNVRHGDSTNLIKQFDDYQFIPTSDNPIDQMVYVYDSLIEQGYSQDDILMLCPFNKHIGSDEINKRISAKYNHNEPIRKNSDIKIGDRVINIKNSYGQSDEDFVANGDIGWLRGKRYVKAERANHFLVDFENGRHEIKSLANLKLSYCISIHKCQGSSAKIVVVLIDRSHDFFLSRNLLYTAITRARDGLIVVGDLDAIKQGLNVVSNEIRNTWLKELLTMTHNSATM